MGCARTLQPRWRYFIQWAASIGAIFLVAPGCAAQAKPETPAVQQPELPWAQDLNKYPGLLPEIGQLIGKLQSNVQLPAARAESRLLPLMPGSTIFFAAIPNYGDAAHQALQVFRQELQESAVLRDWWQHGGPATAGPKIEDSLEKFYQVQQFLGEEIVVAGAIDGREPSFMAVAEVHKPGLKKFLEQMVDQAGGESKAGVRVLSLQGLANAKEKEPKELTLLVRPDFVVGAEDLALLRSFNARLDGGSREFASNPFGQRVAREYEGGLTILAGADLQKIINQAPPSAKQNAAFQHSGFADMKYFIWEHKNVDAESVSQAELSFSGPRRGSAAWLAKSRPLPSLDFVSPKAMMAGTVALTNPAQVFEDVKELASTANPNAFAMLPAAEQALGLSLKDDLLSYLGGELTLELDSITPPKPAWKALLSVRDAARLQQTLSTLFAAMHFQAEQVDEGGVTYHNVRIASPKASVEISYAFVDGYLIIGPSHDAIAEAIRMHRSGGTLAKSPKFLASRPPGHSLDASALFYEDPVAMAALQMRRFAPEMAESFGQLSIETTPTVVCLYGEESAIREASSSGAFDVGGVLVGAAIAIPNLLRSRMAANEASAVGSLRTVNTAQITYEGMYLKRGFAPDLASLGPDPRGPNIQSADHAGLLDATLASESCTGDAWCTKSGFRFRITAVCKQHFCTEFVAVATPVDGNTGTRSFCSTSDGAIRSKVSPPLTSPVSASECKSWQPLQ